jgi:hypothetical protein
MGSTCHVPDEIAGSCAVVIELCLLLVRIVRRSMSAVYGEQQPGTSPNQASGHRHADSLNRVNGRQ